LRAVRSITVTHSYPASVAHAEAAWCDLDRWGAFVDGFQDVVRVTGTWPQEGAAVTWESVPGGRGRVVERVIEHAPGAGLRVAFEDTKMRGEREIRFASEDGGGTRAELTLTYQLGGRGPLQILTDLLFISPQLRQSLQRELDSFGEVL
jgi:uncharacterized membrane protein